jgi:hypothetical protein
MARRGAEQCFVPIIVAQKPGFAKRLEANILLAWRNADGISGTAIGFTRNW